MSGWTCSVLIKPNITHLHKCVALLGVQKICAAGIVSTLDTASGISHDSHVMAQLVVEAIWVNAGQKVQVHAINDPGGQLIRPAVLTQPLCQG